MSMLLSFVKKWFTKWGANKYKEREVFLNSILENIPAMIFIKDAKDLRFKLFNKAGENLLGVERKDLLGKNDYDFFPKDQADFFTEKDRLVLQENRVLDIPEEKISTKFNGERWLHTKKIPLLFIDGIPQYLLGISLDITERKLASDKLKQFYEELELRVKERTVELEKMNFELLSQIAERTRAEEAMRISEEKYRFLANAIPQIVWTMDAGGKVDYVNKNWNYYTGSDFDESEDLNWSNYLHPYEFQKITDKLNNSVLEGMPFEAEFRIKRKDGIYRWFLGRAVPMKDNKGKVMKWFGTSTEIHDYKTVQQNLRQVKEDLQEINERLNQKNQKLTKVNADLDNFIYTASHDLKAPVSNIEGLMGLLSENLKLSVDEQDNEPILELINNSVKRFQNTLKELTEISKIQKNLQEDIIEIDIAEYLEEIKLDITPLIKESNAKIIIDVSKAPLIFFLR